MGHTGAEDLSNSDFLQLVERMSRYCAFQERCVMDVTQKLRDLEVPARMIPRVIEKLTENRFLDETRFAKMFAAGKFRHNRWGRIKIGYELKGRRIAGEIVSQALQEIGEEEYREALRELILKKRREIKTGKNLNIREKIITFVRGKGFEFDLAAEILNELKI
jgi:regulatory protein